MDEFQNFATESFSRILSEARKYRLDLVLAHQFLGQVPDLLRQAVFGNVGRFISFKIGSEDAPVIARELGFPATAENLIDLDRFEAWERSTSIMPKQFKTSGPVPTKGRLGAVRRRTWSRHARYRKPVKAAKGIFRSRKAWARQDGTDIRDDCGHHRVRPARRLLCLEAHCPGFSLRDLAHRSGRLTADAVLG